MQGEFQKDFPLLRSRVQNGARFVYFDNAATTQKPDAVIRAMQDYCETRVANPHRGAYALSGEATEAYEQARQKAAQFIGAASADEIVFTKNTTDSLNLVAQSYAMEHVGAGDEIVISIAEHHSNLLPWQQIARRKNAVLRYVYTDTDGQLSLSDFEAVISEKTKLVSITQISNVLGTVNPVREIAQIAHRNGAVCVVDGAQSVPHMAVNVQELDADFLAFSAHKMLGPEGVGVLYGKARLLHEMEPMTLGGGIVEEVQEQSVSYLDTPVKFEAGTPNVMGAVGLHAAMDYIDQLGFDTITPRERKLTKYLVEKMREIPHVELYGDKTGDKRTGIVAFNIADVHPHDVASILDNSAIGIRAGHHCAQPLMGHLGIHSCCRASLYFYNDTAEVDQFVEALGKVRGWLL